MYKRGGGHVASRGRRRRRRRDPGIFSKTLDEGKREERFWRPDEREGEEWAWFVGTCKAGLRTVATGTRDTGRCCS